MKTILFILILSLIFFGLDLSAYDEQPVHMRTTAPYQNLLKSSFSIERKTIRNDFYPHASGFYIRYENLPYAVTARHVVQKRNKTDNSKVL